jgi:DNA-cytosine methyltransferase
MLVNTTAQRLKVLELFGGIGSPRKALENLGIDTKTVDYVEWWDWPVKAYNKLFRHLYKPQNILDWNMEIDILFHGSPCQDFSTAGKNDLSSGRSILYLRTLEIIGKELKNRPKVVVWENVKGLLSKKNFPHFKHYLDTMESFGYVNHYKVLNSKEFGIPQSRNRVFVVSILKGQTLFNNDFNFDNLEKTEMKPLKSFLEKEVDKSYYITQNSMKKAIEAGKIKIVDNVCETITTKQFRWNNAGVVKVPLTTFESENKAFDIETSVGTLTTNVKTNKIMVPILEMETKDFTNFITIPRQSDGEVINGSHNRVWKSDKYVGTIAASTNTKIMVPLLEINNDYDYRMSDGSKRPIGKINKEGNITIPISNNHTSNKVGVDCAMTITTSPTTSKILSEAIEPIEGVPIFIVDGKPYHLRVLTQRETWRLMGWDDNSIDKVIDMPKTHMYHMAGNAIVIQVLEAIYKELFRGSIYEGSWC